jgi:16S rRNA (cytosine967-C5)-methyltransferase
MLDAQRLAALSVQRVLDGSTLPAALAKFAPPEQDSPGRRRALVQELAYGTLRHWGRLDALVRSLATKPIADSSLHCLVAVAIYQLVHTRAPSFAVVDHAVNAAAILARPAAKALVNALLRRFMREREALEEAVGSDPIARWSHPRWWIERVQREFPVDWQDVLASGNAQAPLALRVNRRIATRDELLAEFAAAGVNATPAGEAGILVEPATSVRGLPGFERGAFSVQDLGAQLAAPLLQPLPGQRVLDACAAPGGKATHLLELAEVELVALDRDQDRLARVRENLLRLELGGRDVDVIRRRRRAQAWWEGGRSPPADVPCTATGGPAAPDVKWLRREADVGASRGSRRGSTRCDVPAHGGLLLYATCSIFEAENEAQVAAFVARHTDALRETLTFRPEVARHGAQLLPSLPGASHNQDGYFYALLRKP